MRIYISSCSAATRKPATKKVSPTPPLSAVTPYFAAARSRLSSGMRMNAPAEGQTVLPNTETPCEHRAVRGSQGTVQTGYSKLETYSSMHGQQLHAIGLPAPGQATLRLPNTPHPAR